MRRDDLMWDLFLAHDYRELVSKCRKYHIHQYYGSRNVVMTYAGQILPFECIRHAKEYAQLQDCL